MPLGPAELCIHTEKYFRNRIKSSRNQIVFTIFQLIWNQTEVRLVRNHSENDTIWLLIDLIRFQKYFSACRNQATVKQQTGPLVCLCFIQPGKFCLCLCFIPARKVLFVFMFYFSLQFVRKAAWGFL